MAEKSEILAREEPGAAARSTRSAVRGVVLWTAAILLALALTWAGASVYGSLLGTHRTLSEMEVVAGGGEVLYVE